MKAISSLAIRPLLLGTLFGVVVLTNAGRASAQDSTSSPPPTSPPPVSSGGGNGIGVGATAFLSGIGGALVNYDQSIWDIEGLLGFSDRRTGGPDSPHRTGLQVGVRGWYHLHRGANSDFSVGGGIGFDHYSGGGADGTATLIEPGVRARVFVTSNVAVHAMLGISMVLGDNSGGDNVGVSSGAQGLFGAGFIYYFK